MSGRPWQLEMFDRSLKKRQKMATLLRHVGDPSGRRCLLVTCGDNNGAMNYHFRAAGGDWRWADVLEETIPDMERLLGEPVDHVDPAHLPYPDGAFDISVAIDVLEHLPDDQPFLQELLRVTKPNGRAVVTVPGGDERMAVNRLKRVLGMTPEAYGHTRWGYTVGQLSTSLSRAGFVPEATDSYSRAFTELVELGINYGYVFVLSRKNGKRGGNNAIAPTSERELKTHGGAYRIYSAAFPVLSAVSRLDRLLPGTGGYAVVVRARRPDAVVAGVEAER